MEFVRRLLFGRSRFPDELRAALSAERPLLLTEGLRGSITYRNYRAPGTRSSWRKIGMSGALAITERRLVVWGAHQKQIDVPFADPRVLAIEVKAERPDRVVFAFDAGAFDGTRSGRVEVRLRGVDATRTTELMEREPLRSPS